MLAFLNAIYAHLSQSLLFFLPVDDHIDISHGTQHTDHMASDISQWSQYNDHMLGHIVHRHQHTDHKHS
jgi:hypothetical protein